jgi:cytochrome c oxidase cbb3-type subunit 3
MIIAAVRHLGIICAPPVWLLASCTEAPLPVTPALSVYDRVLLASPYAIAADSELDAFVTAAAERAAADHCAACHGADLSGKPGVANLVDTEWLWGITFEETNDVGPVMEIQQTILYGVRNTDCPEIASQSLYGGCADTRYSEMPGYREIGVFDDEQIRDIAEYVVSLTGAEADPEAAARGMALWPVCIECHGPEGRGYKPYGGPDLSDDVSLYGADRETIADVVATGRKGACPPWAGTLDAATIKSLAIYIWRKANGG